MERRNFMMNAGILAAFGGMSNFALSNNSIELDNLNATLNPVLLPATAPLDNKGGMQVKTWVRSAMTNGLYSNVECAVAPKLMGHLHIIIRN